MSAAGIARRVRTTESPAIRWLLTALALGFMGLFLVLPLAAVFVEALKAGWTAYWAALKEPDALSAIALTLLCVLCISLGQILFKKAAAALTEPMTLQAVVFNGWLIASLALYGLTTLGWVWILRHAPLHLAYPFMGLAFLIVPTLAWLFLGEPLRWRTLAGGGLIMAGVALASTN